MKSWFGETLQTLSVTTFHPLGWGIERVQDQVRRAEAEARPVSPNLELLSPVVLVHGIFHNATAFYRIRKVLRREGFKRLKTVNLWTSVQSVERMADQLKKEVDRLYNQTILDNPLGKVRIVAHSLGGMVTRTALLDESFAQKVDKVFFLGTPHQGSVFYEFPVPPAVRDLAHHSDLLRRLKEEPLPGGIRYWNFRGGLDLVTPARCTFLPHVPNLFFENVGHAGLLSDRNVVRTVVRLLETPYPAGPHG
jgi:pimeloyl-ACP methyl ester carboxylesterase